MRLLHISLECPSVMCEIPNQTNHITLLLISSFTSVFTGLSWTIVGEIPTIDFTEGVILQTFSNNDPSNIIPKANVYVVC